MSDIPARLQGYGKAQEWVRQHLDYPHKDWCLYWPYSGNSDGYGSFYFEGRTTRVHRVMCEYINGPAPTDRPEAAHTCGNGTDGCVNPHHVTWKSRSDNLKDRAKHGYHRRFKLTPQQVDEIRSLKDRARIADIAEQFGIKDATVRQIHTGKIWKTASSRCRHVFSEQEVHLIRAGEKSAGTLAAEFNVSRSTIERIRRGITYAWVPPASSLTATNPLDKSS